ncbi:hypothetical protein N9J01_00250 [bacterium]|nr:hypothetical protein [bacterium]
MAINKVGSKGIEDGSVATADLADNVVTSAKLGDGEVTNAKLANTTVTLAGQSITLGASLSLTNKFVDWQTVIIAAGSSNTAVSGQGYFVDTTSDVHTVTLPASASRGDFIAIKDYAGTFNTNNLTIARNGHNIQGVANDSLISTNRASLVLVYVDSTKGWLYWEEHNVADLQAAAFITATGGTVTESGDFKIHSFTGDATFVVSAIGNPLGGPNSVDYLVIAGGGSGGGNYGAGGGSGGYRTSFPSPAGTIAVTAQTYPVTIGGGGASVAGVVGVTGSNSVFSTITSTGGGGGGGGPGPGGGAGLAGGSGGGGGSYFPGPYGTGPASRTTAGSGNTPPTSPSQGNDGGFGLKAPNGTGAGGGGGAACAGTPSVNGVSYPAADGGNGGAGSASSITGSSVTRAGGGGGATEAPVAGRGVGGSGGGGSSGYSGSLTGGDGTANTGGGGGGSGPGSYSSGAGGSGIVIIRYKFQ